MLKQLKLLPHEQTPEMKSWDNLKAAVLAAHDGTMERVQLPVELNGKQYRVKVSRLKRVVRVDFYD